MYGKTYGTVTRDSANKNYVKGIEAPPEEMYKSQAMKEFQDQMTVSGISAAHTVGVTKLDDVYDKPLDPSAANKFYGIEDNEMDDLIKEQTLQKDTIAFYGFDPKTHVHKEKPHVEDEEEAIKKFYAIESKKELKLGAPIPGYSGVSRRVTADNVFGMTYAEARRRAEDSQAKIDAEKRETLKMNSSFVPAYKRPKEDDEFF